MLRYIWLSLLACLLSAAPAEPGTAYLTAEPIERYSSPSGGEFRVSASGKISGYIFLLERGPKSKAKWQRTQDLESLYLNPTPRSIYVPGPFKTNWNYCLCLEGDDSYTYHAPAYVMNRDGRFVQTPNATIWPANVKGRLYTKNVAGAEEERKRSMMKIAAIVLLGALGIAGLAYMAFSMMKGRTKKPAAV